MTSQIPTYLAASTSPDSIDVVPTTSSEAKKETVIEYSVPVPILPATKSKKSKLFRVAAAERVEVRTPSPRTTQTTVSTASTSSRESISPVPEDAEEALEFSINDLEVAYQKEVRKRSHLEKALPSVAKAGESVRDAAEKISDTMGKYGILAEQMQSIASSVAGLLVGVYTKIDVERKVITSLSLLYDITVAIVKKMWISIPTLLVRVAQLFDLDAKLLAYIHSAAVTTTNPIQSAEDGRLVASCAKKITDSAGDSMLSLWQRVIGTITLRAAPTRQQLQYVNECFRMKDSVVKSFRDGKDVMAAIVTMLPEAMQGFLQYVIPEKWWVNMIAPGKPFFEWIDAVNALDEAKYLDQASYDPGVQTHIRRLYADGQALLKHCTEFGPKLAGVQRLLESTFKKIDVLWKAVDYSEGRGSRRVPFCVCLTGETGQGKSTLATILPAIVFGVPADTPNLSYTRNQALDHWDGYTGQRCTQYDDFCAVMNPNTFPAETDELMTMISNQPYGLKMARIEDKGAFFRSEMVLLTTNNPHPQPNAIAEISALWRRRHRLYHVSVAPEFRVDGHPEVNEHLIPDDGSHWRFQRLDPMNPTVGANFMGPRMDFGEFCDHIRDSYEQHVASQRRALENMRLLSGHIIANHGLREDFNDFCQTVNPALDDAGRSAATAIAMKLRDLEWAAEQRDEVQMQLKMCRVCLVVCGMAALVVGVGAMCSKIANKHALASAKKQTVALRAEMLELMEMLRSPRVRELTAHGRWDRLYRDIRHTIPDECWQSCIEAMSEKMDEFEGFRDLSDEEVEEIITQTLATPKVQKYLKSHGIYSGHGRVAQPVRSVAPRVVRAQAGIDANALEVVAARIAPVTVTVKLGGISLKGLMVSGRFMLVPDHLFYVGNCGKLAEDGTELTVVLRDVTYKMVFRAVHYHKIATDAALYHCDVVIPGCKNIVSHFPLESELDIKKPVDGMLMYRAGDGSLVRSYSRTPICGGLETIAYYADNGVLDSGEYKSRGEVPRDVAEKKREYMFYQLGYYTCEMPLQRGDCGAVLVRFDKYSAHKVLGIYVAADEKSGTAFFQPVTQEMLNATLGKFQHVDVFPADNCPILANNAAADIEPMVNPEGNFDFVGVLKKAVYINETTKIVPSLIAGDVERVKTVPSVLSMGDPRCLYSGSILKKGIEKYGNVAPLIDVQIVHEIVVHLNSQFEAWNPMMERRVWTVDEALNGVVGVEYAEGINMQTSAGYPYVLTNKKGTSGKGAVIEGSADEHNLTLSPRLAVDVQNRIAFAEKGQRVESYWVDMLKDERRSIMKIFEGATRVFTIPPVDFTVVARMFCNAFVVHFYANRLRFFSAVGIDPMSLEWTRLYDRLVAVGKNGFAGDYTGWDGNIAPQIMMAVCDIVNGWYDDCDVNKRVRRVLFDEMIHTVQIAGNMIYVTHIGNPSGNPFTTVINTIANAIYLRYAWMVIAPPSLRAMPLFDKAVCDAIYGDDNAVAVHPRMEKIFEPAAVSRVLKTLNLSYTDSTKTGPARLQTVASMTFLKRGFRDDGRGYKLPTIDKQTIHELLNWMRLNKDHTPEEATILGINEALEFTFGYGEQEFENLRRRICEVVPKRWICQILPYSLYWNRFYGQIHQIKLVVNHALNGTAISVMSVNSNLPLAGPSDDTDDVREMQNIAGVLNVAQRTMETSGPTLAPILAPRLDQMAITDPEWSMSDVTKRTVLIEVFPWTTASASGTTLKKYELPTDVIVAFFQAMPFERFLYWNGEVKFYLHVNGMRQHCGMLMAYFVPFVRSEITAVWHEINLTTATSMYPVFVDPSVNTETLIHTTYYNPKAFISINGTFDPQLDFTGTLIISVLMPLRAASGSPNSIDLSLWVEMGASKFRIPINSALASLGNPKYAKIVANHGSSQSTTYDIKAYGNIDGNTMPTNMRDDAFAGASASASATIPAFDRAARTWNPFPILRKAIQHFTHTHGTEVVTRLDTSASNMNIVTPEHFGSSTDEMLMSELLHKPTLARIVTWQGSAPSGTVLWSGFIGPMTNMFTPGTGTQVTLIRGQPAPLTLWEINAMRFRMWRGGVRIIVKIAASQFHTGRLIMSVNWGVPPSVVTTLKDTVSQMNLIMDLQNEKKHYEMDIPYVAPTPCLEVCRGPQSDDDVNTDHWWTNYFTGTVQLTVLQSLKTVSTAPPDIDIAMFMCGALDFEVYTFAASNAPFLPVRVFGATPPIKIVANHSGGGSGGGEDAARTTTLVTSDNRLAPTIAPPAHGPLGSAQPHFGKRSFHDSSRDLIRRYVASENDGTALHRIDDGTNSLHQGYANISVSAGDGPNGCVAYRIQSVEPMTATNLTEVSTYNWISRFSITPLFHFGSQFRAWRGSMRYKRIAGEILAMNNADFIGPSTFYGVVFIPHAQFSSEFDPSVVVPIAMNALGVPFNPVGLSAGGLFNVAASPLSADVAIGGIDPVLEIEVPFLSRFNWLPTYTALIGDQIKPEMLSPGLLVWIQLFSMRIGAAVDAPSVLLTHPMDLVSVGDDFRYGIFMGSPLVATYPLLDDGTGPAAWPSTWVVTDPPVRKRKIVKKDSDDDFVKIVANHGAMMVRASHDVTSQREVPNILAPANPLGTMRATPRLYHVDNIRDKEWQDIDSVISSKDALFLRMQELVIKMNETTDVYEHHFLAQLIDEYDIDYDNYVGEHEILVKWHINGTGDLLLNGCFSVPMIGRGKSYRDRKMQDKEFISMNALDVAFLRDIWKTVWTFLYIRRQEIFRDWPLDDVMTNLNCLQLCMAARRARQVAETPLDILANVATSSYNARIVANHAARCVEPKLGTGGVISERKPPTYGNLKQTIEKAYGDYTSKKINARMALNEIKMGIDTVNIETSTTSVGPPHTPFFTTKVVFHVDQKHFDGTSGCGDGDTKKEAEERGAYSCLGKLNSLGGFEEDPPECEWAPYVRALHKDAAYKLKALPFLITIKDETDEVVFSWYKNQKSIFNEHLRNIKVTLSVEPREHERIPQMYRISYTWDTEANGTEYEDEYHVSARTRDEAIQRTLKMASLSWVFNYMSQIDNFVGMRLE